MPMKEKKTPSLFVALIPIVSMVVILFVGLFVFEADAHIPLLLSAVVAAIVAKYLGYEWRELEKGIISSVSLSLQALIILMIIGTIIATWLAAGIVPTMIYYGLEFLSPTYFLPIAAVICSIVALASGNAWTAAGTIGIAIMGVGIGLGINPAMVAGAVVSGCYFGDKISPLSETTNMAPGITGVQLFDHIRHMLYTTIPGLIIAVIIYFFIGLANKGNGAGSNEIDVLQQQLSDLFVISPWLLLVPVIVLGMIAAKTPAIPGLVIGSIMGAIVAIFVQGVPVSDIFSIAVYGFSKETGNEVLDNLLNNGGTEAMMYTVSLVMIAMSFGGILETSGVLQTIVDSLLKLAKSTGSLITATVATCVTANVVACDQYLSILIPGRMYLTAYKKRGLHAKNLSRTLEDAGTMTSPLVPWNTCGAFMSATLGVATLSYAPYAILNIISPLIAIIYAFVGFKIEKLPAEEMKKIELDEKGVNVQA
ncbi:MAG: Na+/H+ antiporter NhaC [Bacillaceae bacterium]|jgi:NhaC family Na+:H+ antiporter|uniref:Na+/H+ antiporter NhaC n=2 Tax=Bacillaceae TaxID=186817 RepID=A0A165Z1Z5_9BACI|nr:Na+/H+ antiporter NhaC [Aeribacillus pallidus]REJ16935.1 MAG: Na+/H+ antiporter NhaC [Bacillaceae bacterium]REJ25652.1 MAG: Na+/H+ antiporter NhaC [Bacillaceae bacterium]RZI51885.1 Na+/H+ antiporter NhaC [Aeribacillus pallidus]